MKSNRSVVALALGLAMTLVLSVFVINQEASASHEPLRPIHAYSDPYLAIGDATDGAISFVEHPIADGFDGANSMHATDLDGDGDVDVLGAAFLAGDINWWENDGSESFTEHTIADSFGGANSVHATDLDGDGDVDVLGAAYQASRIAWWENDGSESFTDHTIADGFESASSACASDVDGDGDVDVLGVVSNGEDISWWENDGNESFTKRTIAGDLAGVTSVRATDVDLDGDIDVLAATYFAGDVTWWENDGSEAFTEHTITDTFDGVNSVCTADVDGDGDLDVLVAASVANEIGWWENDGSESFTQRTVAGDLDGAGSACAADVDDDGDMDVLAGWGGGNVGWWENDGSESFTKRTIADDFEGVGFVSAVLLDGDHDVDVLGSAFSAGNIAWWEQVGAGQNNPPNSPTNPTPADGSTEVPVGADLSWTGGDPDGGDSVTYHVYLGTSSPPPLEGTVGPYPANRASISYDPGLLDDNTQYVWYVVAADGQDVSTTGATWGFTTGGASVIYLPLLMRRYPPIPSVPFLAGISNPEGDGNYTVRWNAADLAEEYVLQEDDNLGFSSPTERYSGPGLSWIANGKAPGTYYYRVKATNAWGDSAWSDVRQVIVFSPPSRPTLNPIDNADGDGYYTVRWNTVAQARTYTLEEDTNASFSSPTTRYTGSGTSWSASGKSPGTYYYRVKASNSMGESSWSNVRQVTVTPPLAEVYVGNYTGGELCYEVYGTGIGRKCFPSGDHFYGSFPPGTYTYSASAWCGSISEEEEYESGEWIHEFVCE